MRCAALVFAKMFDGRVARAPSPVRICSEVSMGTLVAQSTERAMAAFQRPFRERKYKRLEVESMKTTTRNWEKEKERQEEEDQKRETGDATWDSAVDASAGNDENTRI